MDGASSDPHIADVCVAAENVAGSSQRNAFLGPFCRGRHRGGKFGVCINSAIPVLLHHGLNGIALRQSRRCQIQLGVIASVCCCGIVSKQIYLAAAKYKVKGARGSADTSAKGIAVRIAFGSIIRGRSFGENIGDDRSSAELRTLRNRQSVTDQRSLPHFQIRELGPVSFYDEIAGSINRWHMCIALAGHQKIAFDPHLTRSCQAIYVIRVDIPMNNHITVCIGLL